MLYLSLFRKANADKVSMELGRGAEMGPEEGGKKE
jgi:hypothetical protein